MQNTHLKPLTAGLPEEAVAAILARCKRRTLQDGEYLYRQGDSGDALYGVVKGRIRVGNTSPDGRELLVMLAERGEWIGEISLFDEGPRSQDAYAVGEVEVLAIAKQDFDALLADCPELYRHFLPMLCKKLRLALSYVESAMLYPLSARVAKHLLGLDEHYAELGEDGERSVKLPQDDLAKMLGVSRQAVSRELKRLEKAGIIAVAYGRVKICDAEALARETAHS